MSRARSEKVVPPTPCLTFRVACVGHISVEMDSAPHVAAAQRIFGALSDCLRDFGSSKSLGQAYRGAGTLVALSSLAAGSDLLLAGAAVGAGATLHVALPFSPEEFARDFAGKEADLRRHEELRGKAERLFVHDGRRGDDGKPIDKAMRNRAYQENGRTLVRHCDLLVAIWNGREAAGVGGTAEQVEQAVRLGIPVVWIDAAGETAGGDPEAAIRWIGHRKELIVAPDRLGAAALRKRLDDHFDAVLSIPGSTKAGGTHHGISLRHPLGFVEGHKPSEADQLDHFYKESVRTRGGSARGASAFVRWLTLHDWLRDRLFSSAEREALESRTLEEIETKLGEKGHGRAWETIDPAKQKQQSPADRAADGGAPSGVSPAYHRAYLVPDTIATELAKAMRTLTLLVMFLAMLAIVFAALALVVPKDWSKDWKAALAIAELVVLSSVAALVFHANSRRMKERWQHYRLLAELLRVNQALAPFGRVLPLSVAAGEAHVGGAVPKWVTWYVNAVTREIGLAAQNLSDKQTRIGTTAAACRDLLLGQIRYHRINTARVERLDKVSDSLGQWAVVLTVLILLAKLGIYGFAIKVEAPVQTGLTLLTVLVPVMAASVFALRHVEEWALLGQRSRAMGDALEASLVDDLAPMLSELGRDDSDSALTMVEVGNSMVRVGRDMVSEVGNWLAVVDTKRMEVG